MRLILILHNIRSVYNVGAILRTAECFGVEQVIFSGYTPHPEKGLPHEREKLSQALQKTALGAEKLVPSTYSPDIFTTIKQLKSTGYTIVALEQAPNSVTLGNYQPPAKLALILGEEVHGIPPDLLATADTILEIPQRGQKESLNVSIAASIAIWEMTKINNRFDISG